MRALLALLFIAAACGGDDTTGAVDAPTLPDFDRRALLRNLGENIVIPLYTTFDAQADALIVAVDASCAAIGTVDEDARRAVAQDAWRTAMTTWQHTELMQVGPAAMDSGTLRDRIYSWNVVSSCAVDQEVMARWNAPGSYDISTKLTNRRGLPAIEYAIFTTNLAVTCAPQVAPAGWDNLTDVEKRTARCGFASAAAVDLAAQAQTLLDAWLPAGGDYVSIFAAAGGAGSPFASAHAAVNVVTDALFYVDSDVKDMKVAEPAGITTNSCMTIAEPCLAELESPWSAHGKENVAANLRGLQMVFRGEGPMASGPGFDDFLIALNAPELAAAIDADIADAIARVEAIPGTLGDAVQTSRPAVVDAHAAIKRITDNMKSQFLTVLSLDIPDDIGDDTD